MFGDLGGPSNSGNEAGGSRWWKEKGDKTEQKYRFEAAARQDGLVLCMVQDPHVM